MVFCRAQKLKLGWLILVTSSYANKCQYLGFSLSWYGLPPENISLEFKTDHARLEILLPQPLEFTPFPSSFSHMHSCEPTALTGVATVAAAVSVLLIPVTRWTQGTRQWGSWERLPGAASGSCDHECRPCIQLVLLTSWAFPSCITQVGNDQWSNLLDFWTTIFVFLLVKQ